MIVRVWQGRARPEQRDAYPAHFRDVVAADLRAVDGFLGGRLLVRELEGVIEFTVMTRWASMDAIRAFAGDDVERAVVEPGAVAALSDFDRTVAHHEVIETVEPPGAAGG